MVIVDCGICFRPSSLHPYDFRLIISHWSVIGRNCHKHLTWFSQVFMVFRREFSIHSRFRSFVQDLSRDDWPLAFCPHSLLCYWSSRTMLLSGLYVRQKILQNQIWRGLFKRLGLVIILREVDSKLLFIFVSVGCWTIQNVCWTSIVIPPEVKERQDLREMASIRSSVWCVCGCKSL